MCAKSRKKYCALQENNITLYPDHALPTTRRGFLTAGLITSAGYFFGPSIQNIMNLSPTELKAAEVATANYHTNIPYMCFDNSGGMNLSGSNVLVGFEKEEQLCFGSSESSSDYLQVALPDGENTQHPKDRPDLIDTKYGIKFHGLSGMLEGLDSVLDPPEQDMNNPDPNLDTTDLRNSIEGTYICAISNDDTNSNPHNTVYAARKAGAHGDLVQLLGNNPNGNTGGNSIAPSDHIDLSFKPAFTPDLKSGESLISIGDDMMGTNYMNGSDPVGGALRLRAFMEKILRVGNSRFDNTEEVARAIATVKERNIVNSTLSGAKGIFDKYSPAQLNPLKSNDGIEVKRIFGALEEDENGIEVSYTIENKLEENTATIANLVTNNIAGAGTISLGNRDYHDGTASNGHGKDFELGVMIGKTIKLAAKREQNLFIHIFTDGSTVADSGGARQDGDGVGGESGTSRGRINWVSDGGYLSGVLMLVYKHGQKRINTKPDANGTVDELGESSNMLLNGKTRQIGWFRKPAAGKMTVDASSSPVANSTGDIWKVVMLNYIACMVKSENPDEAISLVKEHFEKTFGRGILEDDLAEFKKGWGKYIRFRSLVTPPNNPIEDE